MSVRTERSNVIAGRWAMMFLTTLYRSAVLGSALFIYPHLKIMWLANPVEYSLPWTASEILAVLILVILVLVSDAVFLRLFDVSKATSDLVGKQWDKQVTILLFAAVQGFNALVCGWLYAMLAYCGIVVPPDKLVVFMDLLCAVWQMCQALAWLLWGILRQQVQLFALGTFAPLTATFSRLVTPAALVTSTIAYVLAATILATKFERLVLQRCFVANDRCHYWFGFGGWTHRVVLWWRS